MFVAVIGTTISPYLLFWQTSEEAEEDVAKHRIKEIGEGKPKVSPREIMSMKEDIGIGMFFSQFIMWSIIVTSAGSLYFSGITNVQTADQAASALEPLVKSFPNSGQIAKVIFAFGIIGTGLLAIPVLSASSAFALSDTFGWKEGLEKKFSQAKSFYSVIIASTLIGVWITFSHINPIQALILAAVINAVVTVPILFIVMRLANDKKILGDKVNSRFSNIIGWFTFAIMTASVIVMFLSFAI
jgi:Mn2+/Fe2+ NRAMP family transporter